MDYQRLMHPAPPDDVIFQWKRYTSTLNRTVRVVTLNETTEGTAVDIDKDGALMVRLPDGTIHRIVYGDCFHKGNAERIGQRSGVRGKRAKAMTHSAT